MTLLESLRHYADYPFHSHEYEKTGDIGEQHLYRELIALFGKENIFRNLYLEKENGKTTEIDLLAIHSTGIYVFESKNYKRPNKHFMGVKISLNVVIQNLEKKQEKNQMFSCFFLKEVPFLSTYSNPILQI